MDIGGLSPDDIIRSEMGRGPIGQAVGGLHSGLVQCRRTTLPRVDVRLLRFHSIVYSGHMLVSVHIKLDKTKVSMSGHWKLNVFGERNF